MGGWARKSSVSDVSACVPSERRFAEAAQNRSSTVPLRVLQRSRARGLVVRSASHLHEGHDDEAFVHVAQRREDEGVPMKHQPGVRLRHTAGLVTWWCGGEVL